MILIGYTTYDVLSCCTAILCCMTRYTAYEVLSCYAVIVCCITGYTTLRCVVMLSSDIMLYDMVVYLWSVVMLCCDIVLYIGVHCMWCVVMLCCALRFSLQTVTIMNRFTLYWTSFVSLSLYHFRVHCCAFYLCDTFCRSVAWQCFIVRWLNYAINSVSFHTAFSHLLCIWHRQFFRLLHHALW